MTRTRRTSQGLAALASIFAAMLTAMPARADGNVTAKVSSELAGYIDSVGVAVFTPSIGGSVEDPTAGWSANGRYLVDIVSAASPDIVATASPHWTEVRNAGSVGARYKPDTFGVGVGGAVSSTPDYLALSGNAQLTQELDEKNILLVLGYSFGRDTIGRTGTPFSVFSRDLTTHGISGGISRVINRNLVLSLFADAILERGNQAKPYRYVPLFSPEIAPTIPRGAGAILVADSRIGPRPIEQLPLQRDRWALTGRLAYRTELTTVRLDERLYDDDWGLRASTTDFRWFIDVGKRVRAWPHLRFHAQNGTDFWQRAYASRGPSDIPALRTGDRELSPLSSLTVGGGVRIALGRAGAEDDVSLTLASDGTWTSFADTLYVKNRFSGLGTSSIEVVF
jgi:hypothetical protein